MRKAAYGWLGIVAWVTAYDVWAMKTKNITLSQGFWNSVHHRHYRWVVIPVWAALTWHLFTGHPQPGT